MTEAYTVIMPAYNAAQTIAEALHSLMRQTVPPERVIVVDDGSSDDTGRIAETFGVDLLRQSNQGPGAACNRALEAVTTSRVAYLDADDIWVPEKAEWQLSALSLEPGLSGSFGHLQIFHHGRPIDPNGRVHEGWGRTALMARTEAVRAIGPIYDPPEGGSGDMVDWIARGRDLGHRFLMLKDIVAFRRIIPGSMTYGRGEADRGYLDVVHRALQRKREMTRGTKP